MKGFLEGLLSLYFDNKCIFLHLSLLIFIIGIICINSSFTDKVKRKYLINKALHNFFNSVVIVFISFVLGNIMNIDILKNHYEYFNALVFFGAVFLIVLLLIIRLLIFGIKDIICLQSIRWLFIVSYLELILLSVCSSLDLPEYLVLISMIIFLDDLSYYKKESIKKKKTNEILKESDFPNPELIYKRQVQLKKFKQILKEQIKEPYAVMINAKWGMGKTSFVMALEKELTKDIFIWIEAGSEKSVEQIMRILSVKIIQILKENNIFIENEALVEKYFFSYLKDSKLKVLNQFIINYVLKSDESDKEYINNKLGELNRTIYLVIDDLDRCRYNYQKKIFKVLRESTNLTNCKTIFLVDKEQLSKYDVNYLEKYVSFTLDLCEIEYTEIVQYFIGYIFKKGFFDKINETLKKGRHTKEIEKMILTIESEIVQNIKKDIKDLTGFEDEIFKDDTSESKPIKAEIKEIKKNLNELLNYVTRNTKNIRKVKNFLKSLKYSIENVELEIENIYSETYRNKDWLIYIMNVQFLKHFLPEIYVTIRNCFDYLDFLKKYDNYHINNILTTNDVSISTEDCNIYDELLFRADDIDYSNFKTEREKYLNKLKKGSVEIEEISSYIQYVKTYDDINKILEICETQKNDNFEFRTEFIENLFELLSRQSMILELEISQLLDISYQLVRWLTRLELLNQEKNVIKAYSTLIIRRVIVDNGHFLRNILCIFFNIKDIKKIWGGLDVTNINELYSVICQLDIEFAKNKAIDDKNKFECIATYYGDCMDKLQDKKYKDLKINLDNYQETLNQIIETCHLWLNINDSLELSHEVNESKENAYFDLIHYELKETSLFKNVESLEKGLEILSELINSKNDYKSEYSRLLMQIALKCNLKIEENPEWFKDRKQRICNLLTDTSDIVYELDTPKDKDSRMIIEQLKVFVFKLCKES